MYHYYKALPEDEQPDSVEAMQPLFHAVAHGCAADLHQQALAEVYYPRIQRSGNNYLCKKLGSYNDDLAMVAHFFRRPWGVPVKGLPEAAQAFLLNEAGNRLHALGRLDESAEPMQASIKMNVIKKSWKGAAANACNLSELQLTVGRLADALASAEQSVGYADQSGYLPHRRAFRAIRANALHQSGQSDKAYALFVEAEELQQEGNSDYQQLYLSKGFKYCDLLLARGSTAEVFERVEYALKTLRNGTGGLLSTGLDKLSLGRAYHALNDLSSARCWLDQAVSGLREAGSQVDLPSSLLARAALWRDLNEYTLAQQDLAEVWEIAEPSGMRLFMTDYHLEMARLLLKNPTHSSAEEKTATATDHINAAESLINETGYHRRDDELAALKNESTQ